MAMNVRQLVRLFYYYSRIKSSIDNSFVGNVVERVYSFMEQLSDRDYGLVIKAVAGLNYQDKKFVNILKGVNYELFLVNLKYDCRQMGSYYKAILE